MPVGSLLDVLQAVRDEFNVLLISMGEMLLSKIKIMALIDEIMNHLGVAIDPRPEVLPISADIPPQLGEFAGKMFQMVKDPSVLHVLGEAEIKNPIGSACKLVEETMENRREGQLAVSDHLLAQITDIRRRFRVVVFRYFRFILCAVCQNRDAWRCHFDTMQFPCHLFPLRGMTSSTTIPFSASLAKPRTGQNSTKTGMSTFGSAVPLTSNTMTPSSFPPEDPSLSSSAENILRREDASHHGDSVVPEGKVDARCPLESAEEKIGMNVDKSFSRRSSDEANNRGVSPSPSGFSVAPRSSVFPSLKRPSSAAIAGSTSKITESSLKPESAAGPGFLFSFIVNSPSSWGINAECGYSKSTMTHPAPLPPHSSPHPLHHHHHPRPPARRSVGDSSPRASHHSVQRRHSHSGGLCSTSSIPTLPGFFCSKSEAKSDIQRLHHAVMECKSRLDAVMQSVRRSVERLIEVEEFLEYLFEPEDTLLHMKAHVTCFPSCSQGVKESRANNILSSYPFSFPMMPSIPRSPTATFEDFNKETGDRMRITQFHKSYRQFLVALGTTLDCFMGTCVLQEEEERAKNTSYYDVSRGSVEGAHRMVMKSDPGGKSFSHCLFPSVRLPPLVSQEKEEDMMPKFAGISLVSSFTALLSAQCGGTSELGFGDSLATGALQSPPLSYCSVVEFEHSTCSTSPMDSNGLHFGVVGMGDSSTGGENHNSGRVAGGRNEVDCLPTGFQVISPLPYAEDSCIVSSTWPLPQPSGEIGVGSGFNRSGGANEGTPRAKSLTHFESERSVMASGMTAFPNSTRPMNSYHHPLVETLSKAHPHKAARIRQEQRFFPTPCQPSLTGSSAVSFAPFMTPPPANPKSDAVFPLSSAGRIGKRANSLASTHAQTQNPHTSANEETHLMTAALLFKLEMVVNNLSAEFAACFLQIVPEILQTCPLILREDGTEYKKIKLKKDVKTISLPKIRKCLKVC